MSNTATAKLWGPVIAAFRAALDSLQGVGGLKAIVISTALASSVGMAMPIVTPFHALAYATGQAETGHMARVESRPGQARFWWASIRDENPFTLTMDKLYIVCLEDQRNELNAILDDLEPFLGALRWRNAGQLPKRRP